MNKANALIGLDLDGTVFNNEKRITDAVKRAIMDALGSGIIVLPVSGRYLGGLPVALMEIEGIDYAITSNGAMVYRVDDFKKMDCRLINSCTLSDEKVLETLDVLEQYDTLPDLFAYGGGHMLIKHRSRIPSLGVSKPIEEYLMGNRDFIPDFRSYLKLNSGRIEKITTNFNLRQDGIDERLRCKEKLLTIDGVSIVSGSSHNLEITSWEATKGRALLRLAKLLGIDEARTCAVGDDENDLDMIERAGFGVAMGNAASIVKERAQYITKTNEEDGVVGAIEHFVEYLKKL